jgi:hypothetical protein
MLPALFVLALVVLGQRGRKRKRNHAPQHAPA